MTTFIKVKLNKSDGQKKNDIVTRSSKSIVQFLHETRSTIKLEILAFLY